MIEAIVAIGIIATIMMVLSAGVASGMRAALDAKVLQKATALGNQQVEWARSLPYEALAMRTATPTSEDTCAPEGTGQLLRTVGNDPRLTGTTVRRLDPDGSGPLASEPVAVQDSGTTLGAVFPHVCTVSVAETTFTVSRYVTWVDANIQGGNQRDQKRFVVIVTWPQSDTLRTFRTSTLISQIGRGLEVSTAEMVPLEQTRPQSPNPALAANSSSTQTVTFEHTITNLDTPERFDLTLLDLPSGWTGTLFKVAPDGTHTTLTDTNSNGIVDTGLMDTAERLKVAVVVSVPPNQPASPRTITFRATRTVQVSLPVLEAKDTVNVA